MRYAKISTTNEVIFYPGSLEYFVLSGAIPSIDASASALLAAGIVEVAPATSGMAPENEYVKDLWPVKQADGTWKEEWVQKPTTEEQKQFATAQKAKLILDERAYRLSCSDWTQMPDVVLANKSDWATYRQALRDIPAQAGYPWTVAWPTHPNNM